MFIANVMLLAMNIPLAGVIARLLPVANWLLVPGILAVSTIGVYSVHATTFDLMMVGLGIDGYLLRKRGVPMAPLILGFVLGDLMEQNLRRALSITNREFGILIGSPISKGLWIGVAAMLVAPPLLRYVSRRSARTWILNNPTVDGERRSDLAVTLPTETLRRRAAVMASLEVLQISATRPHATGTACALAAGSPFGSVYVNSRNWTLFMACVNLCPTGALNSSENRGRVLEFVESRCVQCGICAAGCPEHAITLQPRLLTGAQSRAKQRTLKQDSAHHCTQCGEAFISTALLAKGLEIMQATQRLDTRGIALMKMCSSCRSRAATE